MDNGSSSGKASPPQEDRFLTVPLRFLRIDTVADFDIYIRPQPGARLVLYRQMNLPFTQDEYKHLHAGHQEYVYADISQKAQYHRYLEANLSTILADKDIPLDEKTSILYESAQGLLQDALSEPRAGELVSRSRRMVQNTCAFLYRSKAAFHCLMRVCSYDYYTYSHSVNVFMFSVALAQRVHYPSDQIEEFGVGALLHDIGKSMIDPEIINCRTRLTTEQFQIMKLHPVYGYDILKERGDVGEIALDVTRHHHEKIRGNGYPDNLIGEQISHHARIVTIADIFDALTTRRSYKSAMHTFPAIKLMQADIAADLDPALFPAFIEMISAKEE